jgi:hypothetical protein
MRRQFLSGQRLLLACGLILQTSSLYSQSPADPLSELDPTQVFREADDDPAIELSASGTGYSEPPSETPPRWATMADVFPCFTDDASLAEADPVSDLFPTPMGGYAFVDYDAFRGVPDGAWENNGIRVGGNVAARLGPLSDATGIGMQLGASIGVYDWAGTDYRMQHQGRAETQGFFTYGLYRRPTEDLRLTAGLVQDWAFNDTYGVFGTNATMSQLRGQVGYAMSASNEFGVWGAVHVVNAQRNIPGFGPTTYQPISHISGYWHHKWFAGGPDSWISIGVPERSRLVGGGSLGDYLVSATAMCPFNDVIALNASVTYMHQSAGLGGAAAREDIWNYIVGISIFPGRGARASTVAGRRWMPLLPVANNGTFLVDASNAY